MDRKPERFDCVAFRKQVETGRAAEAGDWPTKNPRPAFDENRRVPTPSIAREGAE